MIANKNQDALLIRRSFKARFFHVALFECIAILLTALFLSRVMGDDLTKMGVLSVIISLIATAWNGVFNYLFDRLQNRSGFSRSGKIRVLHAASFECGLVLLTLPVISLYLQVGLWTAFWLEASLLLFFLPYSVAFNYIYDKIYIWFANKYP